MNREPFATNMLVEIKLFAVAKQMAGSESLQLELPERATVRDLRSALIERVPELERIAGNLMFAVSQQYASDEAVIPAGAEIACIPPVSGG